jgi:ATPase family associated with various cellular activities (AAA)
VIAYRDSDEHLGEELARVDQLVRAQTVRWRALIAAFKPEQLWGMVHVTDEEVDAYLNAPFAPPADVTGPYVEVAATRRKEIDARLAATPLTIPLRLRRLCEAFRLSAGERDALLVCLLAELDGRYRRLYGYLQDDVSQPAPSVELLLDILRPVAGGRALFEPGGRLLTHELLVVPDDRQDPRPLAARAARLDERIVAHLLGNGTPDGRLARILFEAGPAAWDDLALEAEQVAGLRTLAASLRAAAPVVFLEGPYGSGRLAAARALCTAADMPLLVADVEEMLCASEPLERVVDLCLREARLRDAALYWAGCEALLEPDRPDARWKRLIARVESATGPIFLAATCAWDPVGRLRERPFVRIPFPAPAYPRRRLLWERCLPPVIGDRAALAEQLANDFSLTHGQILDALVAARAEALRRDPLHPRLTPADVREGCRRQAGRRLENLARRIEPRSGLTFDDLVLPPASRQQLDELRNRIRHRGRVHQGIGFDRRTPLGMGLVAMFTGASGTGKTMAAALLAAEQAVDLYKIDLSAVVSKYVGETEKNLRQVFEEAEDANAILFFDEADALFGKRGEVHDARDRWANIEVNYLLQRVEEFSGPVILASNLSQNIDDAFLRRIHVIVDFPFPDAAARRRIWQRIFPPGLGRPSNDELATVANRFALAGGSIRNVALDATFAAVVESNGSRPVVSLRNLVAATAREYEKLSRPVTPGEFGEKFYAWVEPAALNSCDQ